ncbi:MAG TPA: glycoside hydrolase family 57 protein [Oscillatoriaceae cyanobacterium]
MTQKLHVAFVWHMHQPLYKDRLTGHYLMPWVRLHAQKDYLDMLEVLKPYLELRQTFNLVPSLLEQLVDYAEHEAWDRALELLVKPVERMSQEDKAYLLERAFDLNWAHMLRPYARFSELADRRETLRALSPEERLAAFDEQDWRDLSTWFNLAWFDPLWLSREPALAALVARDRGFTQEDREGLYGLIRAHLKRVIPAYRDLAASGQIELTTTPYYHPILPLLCDTDSAREARPELPLPRVRFAHPEDARAQIRRGIDDFVRHFERAPRGMWPSEQSVSPEALALIAESGLDWSISDEGILARTLGLSMARDARGIPYEAASLYQPYRVQTPNGPVSMIFRDLTLSDLIGFHYAQLPGEEAAADLHARLTRIRQVLPDGGEAYLVTIALDGENCWEHYAQDGFVFLDEFYRRVARDPLIELVSVGDFLDRHPPRRTLDTIAAGSWIASDFTTWIGEPTKNRAWDLLSRTRSDLVAAEAGLDDAIREAAWEEIRIAEGSDWFWWFGEGHDSGQDELFDLQFRLHLRNVYQLAGLTAPAELDEPLAMPVPEPASGKLHLPSGALAPGEWHQAAVYDPTRGQGAMHAAAKVLQRLTYGTDAEHLYVAAEFAPQYEPQEGDELVLYFCYPGRVRHNSAIALEMDGVSAPTSRWRFGHALHVHLGWPQGAILMEASEYDGWRFVAECERWAMGETLELSLPLAMLDVPPGQEVHFVVATARGGAIAEVLPPQQPLHLVVPRQRMPV